MDKERLIEHLDFLFDRNPESARINPDNLIILVDHITCDAYELPFKEGEIFDKVEIKEVFFFLAEENILHHQGDKWF